MPDFVIAMRPSGRWRFKLDRPHSNALTVVTVETRRAQHWADKHMDDSGGFYMYWLSRRNVGAFVRQVRMAGFNVKFEAIPHASS